MAHSTCQADVPIDTVRCSGHPKAPFNAGRTLSRAVPTSICTQYCGRGVSQLTIRRNLFVNSNRVTEYKWDSQTLTLKLSGNVHQLTYAKLLWKIDKRSPISSTSATVIVYTIYRKSCSVDCIGMIPFGSTPRHCGWGIAELQTLAKHIWFYRMQSSLPSENSSETSDLR